ncbi:hypothetical protein INT46_011775 [Mucor plumbeus]|uniref:Uncharacterized protein n=1 Tax=Mucor plumbeus TaxID=97098 RepID=A0A8H7UY61_9FUNG|nr:hypothetical protein INT46_011775 [Mucor plumbeus]
MDLSWCIMCDKRILDNDNKQEYLSMADSLYCSEECKLNDSSNNKLSSISTLETTFKPVARKSIKRTILTPNYPWIPCYNKRRHNYYLPAASQIKRCSSPAQPTAVAGSDALSLIH